MQNLHKILNDKIGKKKTPTELQRVEVSLNTQTRKLWENLGTISSDYLRDYGLTHVMVQQPLMKPAQQLKPSNANCRLCWK
jgi:hypothetical protein